MEPRGRGGGDDLDCAAEVADEMATLVGDAIFVNGMAGLAAHVGR